MGGDAFDPTGAILPDCLVTGRSALAFEICAKVHAGLQIVQYGPDRQGPDFAVGVEDVSQLMMQPTRSAWVLGLADQRGRRGGDRCVRVLGQLQSCHKSQVFSLYAGFWSALAH